MMCGFSNRLTSFPWQAGLLGFFLLGSFPAEMVADSLPPAKEFREAKSESAEKQRAITIGFYLLIALVIGVVSLMGVLMLWGARVRRLARKPLPNTSPNDPLWYLKGKSADSCEPPDPLPDAPSENDSN